MSFLHMRGRKLPNESRNVTDTMLSEAMMSYEAKQHRFAFLTGARNVSVMPVYSRTAPILRFWPAQMWRLAGLERGCWKVAVPGKVTVASLVLINKPFKPLKIYCVHFVLLGSEKS